VIACETTLHIPLRELADDTMDVALAIIAIAELNHGGLTDDGAKRDIVTFREQIKGEVKKPRDRLLAGKPF
jgi:hypothetical protein